MKRNAVIIMAGAVALACAVPCRALVEVEGALWLMSPSGEGAVGRSGTKGTTVDIEDDLGFDSEENLLSLRVIAGDRHQFGLAHLGADLSGNRELDKDVRFHNVFFPSGTRISSEMQASIVQGFYRLNVGSSFARGGAHVGLQYMDFSFELDSEDEGNAENDLQAVMPIAGVFFLGHPVPYLGLRGSIEGSAWDLGDVAAAFLDIELAVEWNVVSGLYVAGGYRQTTIKAEDNDTPSDVDLQLSGPILYVGFEW
ncbi:MAG: hypothetical protein JXB04_02725 [Kiritimatiellae bacterium]|nr:hypothetical protein [Kiritimatiellia bacterium]